MSVVTEWFSNILQLKEDDTLFIVCIDRIEQTKLKNDLNELRDKYMLIDPEETSKIYISRADKKGKFYVRAIKEHKTLMMGSVRDVNNNVREILLSEDPDRDRKLMLMLRDGLSLEEIEEILGELTEKEKAKYFI